MITTAEIRIEEFRKGEVVRITSKNMSYRIAKTEKMATIVAEPVAKKENLKQIENIRFTAFCSAIKAEQLIKNLSN